MVQVLLMFEGSAVVCNGGSWCGRAHEDCACFIVEDMIVYDSCICFRNCGLSHFDYDNEANFVVVDDEVEESSTSSKEEDGDMCCCVGENEIRCRRFNMASLSTPFKTMLYGGFVESQREKINFSRNGFSLAVMRAAEIFSRTKRLDQFEPNLVLELLSLANRFCCEDMKSACDAYLAYLVCDLENAVLLIEYRLEVNAYLLVATCLQVFLRELSSSMHCSGVMKLLCSPEIVMEEEMRSNTTVMLLERLVERAAEGWEKQLAFHRLGVFMLDRKEYKDAQHWFEAAVEAGHVYSSEPSEMSMQFLTLDPNYMMFYGNMHGGHLVELLCPVDKQGSQADCWMQLYERWSSVDDIGSLAVVHQMLANDPGKSLLRFRQSLLLLRLNSQKAAMRSLWLARNHSTSDHERLLYEGWILYGTGHREEALAKDEESISIQRSFEAYLLKAYALADSVLDSESSKYVIHLLEEALRCPSDGLRKGQALNNLGSVYVDCDKLDLAADYYMNALNIKHTRAHQGLACVYHLKNHRKAAYDEITKLVDKAQNNASAYEKRSEYCDRNMAKSDLSMATQLDPLRTYPYRYRAAVLMDDHKEAEGIAELTRAIDFKPDLQFLYLRAAFQDSMSDYVSTLRDCDAALCLDPNHVETTKLCKKAWERVNEQK
ncbi:hypothetical protein TanjilG_06401 [Lupinus angustifolius]|uniref:BTB domain-containing protein n=1 Tax=Lupinus angustifolius TaxID=3871 RepID=A0A4P1RVV5_LUPAN|nr:hypothetical protein TanjilG_06401 [Lupinus angustifolius]